MSTLKEEVQKLHSITSEALADAEKVDKGNAAASTRLRNTMQEVKKQSQVIREAVLEKRKAS